MPRAEPCAQLLPGLHFPEWCFLTFLLCSQGATQRSAGQELSQSCPSQSCATHRFRLGFDKTDTGLVPLPGWGSKAQLGPAQPALGPINAEDNSVLSLPGNKHQELPTQIQLTSCATFNLQPFPHLLSAVSTLVWAKFIATFPKP